MSMKPAHLRAEPHNLIGAVIGRDAGIIAEKWARRAVEEEPAAKRIHHDVLLDHLPTFLWELGKGLADAVGSLRHCRAAGLHGDQRWECGWSIEEVVRDYQLLRLIVVEHLHESVGRVLTVHEYMAIGVYFDDAIASSVSAYHVSNRSAAAAAQPNGKAAGARSEELLSILGVLGHELRNPLAPLGNALQVLKISGSDPAVVERVRLLMERQHKSLTRLVNDLLDLPRLTQKKMQIRSERLDLCALVREAAEDQRSTFEAAGVRFQAEIPSDPVYTLGDPLRLTQVVGNLLGNAAKFTDHGGEVVVRVTRSSTRPVAYVAVRDTGIGIEAAILPRIFDAFVQADRGFERSRGGLGLGLALVKGIAELHGGGIAAASQGPGAGAEFTVELPVIDLPTMNDPQADNRAPQTVARSILLIEDNRDSADSLKEYLELIGHQVTVAHSGPEGVQLATASPPDVVLCDIGLPGMSGHAVLAELRKRESLARTRIIAFTGHPPGHEGSNDMARFDHYLLKPVDPQRLAEILQQDHPTPPTA